MEKVKEELYLEELLKKIKVKIGYVDDSIEAIDEELQKMDEYYWENYTEFDEYGYENFDNKLNRLTKENESADRLKERHKLLKMLDSPYFARIDFVYEGEEEPESYYIGIGNFSKTSKDIPLVFDWRAPVSSLFYDYDKGMASFTAPAGEMKGEIVLKRQYKIAGGQLKYFFESDINIDDEVLKKELSMNGTDRLKSIVTTIQKEQNKIIRDKTSKILVVQGCAGSGKTSIALHRVAYLLYNSRGTLKANNVLILSPNNVFADYISHILPELNEENISEMEFDFFAAKELSVVDKCEDRYDQIENIAKNGYGKYTKYKQSKEFAMEINGYVLEMEADIVNFKNIKHDGIKKTAEELEILFYEKFPDIPILKRMETIAEYVIDEAETLRGRDFEEEEVFVIKEKFEKLYVTKNIFEIYKKMSEKMGMEFEYNEEANFKLKYEDLYPLLYLKYKLFGVSKHRIVKHLIIDEMQDYSYIQYLIIETVFKCHMTILGDRNQTIGDDLTDAKSIIKDIFKRNANFVDMKKSYRQTVEIGKFAADIIGEKDIEFFERHGRSPELTKCKNGSEMIDRLCENIKRQSESKEYDTVAVLTMDMAEAVYIYECIKDRFENISYLDKESEKFKKGITVTTFYMAKGLEFDCVHVPSCDERYKKDAFGRQALYISATRAMHEFDMYTI